MTKSFVKLVMVTDTDNHNKEYCMESHGDYFLVRYGRVGARFATKQYPIAQWDKKYQEKIQKGYQDMTAFCEIKQHISQGNWKAISNPTVAKLVEYLLQKARTVLKKEYQYSISQTTQAMVDKVQSHLDILVNSKLSVETFNDILKQIFTIIPRKMHHVDAYLAKSVSDFPTILEREQKLLDTMAGQIQMDTVTDTTQTITEQTILEKMGLHIRPCTSEEESQIRKHLSAESAPLLKQAFRVTNQKTEARFRTFCKENGISRKQIHFYYHGSLAENFWSILTKGLTVHPHAKIAGKMFGHGSYFATRARKSLRYTDIGNHSCFSCKNRVFGGI